MEYRYALLLRQQWFNKGNPTCEHPRIERETYEGTDTGDDVCTSCGKGSPRGAPRSEQSAR